MSNPFLSSGLRERYRNGMVVDLVLAAAALCIWLDLLPAKIPKLELVPVWVWPAIAAFFLGSAVLSWWRRRTRR